jgi:hypothetical protein
MFRNNTLDQRIEGILDKEVDFVPIRYDSDRRMMEERNVLEVTGQAIRAALLNRQSGNAIRAKLI